MKFGELITHACECINTFNPIYSTIDSHADTFLQTFKDPYEKVFVKQVFYGCIRYEEFLKIFTKTLFEMRSSQTNRNDAALYSIFAYLSFFRLDELPLLDFRKLVQSQEATKMHVFMQFAFNADMLREHLRERWMAVFDFVYIDSKIIGGVEKNLPAMQEILRFVEKRATGKVGLTPLTANQNGGMVGSQLNETGSQESFSKSAMSQKGAEQDNTGEEQEFKKITVPIPFNLTKPKPKVIPMPEAIKRETKANPVPKHLHRKPLPDVEKEKEERRQATILAIRKDYEENPKKRFSLATEARPHAMNQEEYNQKHTQVFEAQCKELCQGQKPLKMPDFSKNEAKVNLNVAALKREKYLIDVEEREAALKLAQMEMGLKDASEFIRWQREMDKKDDIIKAEYVIKRKIDMELVREHAIEAQEKKVEQNHDYAVKLKIDIGKKLQEREELNQEEFEKRKETVKQVQDQYHKIADAVSANVDKNKAIRDSINKDLADAAKRLSDEQEVEQAKKEELIRQIRELEKIPIQRTKGFDPTEAGSHGLMIEMSVAELRERLELNRRNLEQEIDFKREQNLAHKEREAQKLIEDADKIHQARLRRKSAQDSRRQKTSQAAQEMEDLKARLREEGVQEVFAVISKKKQEKKEKEEKLALDLKEIKLQRQYMNNNPAAVEQKSKKMTEGGREEKDRNVKLFEHCVKKEIVVSDQMQRAATAKKEVVDKLVYDKGYQERLENRKKENEHLHKKTLEYKSNMHQKQQDFREALRENELKRKPFNAKINEMSMANATTFKNRKMNGESTVEFMLHEDSPGAAHMDSNLDFLGEAQNMQNDIEAKLRQEA